ncbi:hypothetical protein THAOC_14492 [Thalassiosira oceanica]|uniref:Uncharacterized protein n=1 Tax=Thalassiosira oceanica TaxID=159749 RepID=K0SUR6_THAOC|nr:hypothetical protein THAOC_14492 [Thalassiosira oceanica]|eukprot:EJK64741.1 hypothetical protein THAOC_14492 [Thalassiosira oceanica]
MGSGIGSVQIGQKSSSACSCPWLNSLSSLSSAARCLHAFLCFLRWVFWQSTLQYLTRRQAVQFLSFTASLASLPQFAQASFSMPLILEVRMARRGVTTVWMSFSCRSPVNQFSMSGIFGFFCLSIEATGGVSGHGRWTWSQTQSVSAAQDIPS